MGWTDEKRKAASERLRKQQQDPAFKAKVLAGIAKREPYRNFHPGAEKLTPGQLAEYTFLRKTKHYRAAEALELITGETNGS